LFNPFQHGKSVFHLAFCGPKTLSYSSVRGITNVFIAFTLNLCLWCSFGSFWSHNFSRVETN